MPEIDKKSLDDYIQAHYPNLTGRKMKNKYSDLYWYVVKSIEMYGDGYGDWKAESGMTLTTYWLCHRDEEKYKK